MFWKTKKLQYDPKEFEKEFNKQDTRFKWNQNSFDFDWKGLLSRFNEFINNFLRKLPEKESIKNNKSLKDLIGKLIELNPVLKIVILFALFIIFTSSPIFFIIWIIILVNITKNHKS